MKKKHILTIIAGLMPLCAAAFPKKFMQFSPGQQAMAPGGIRSIPRFQQVMGGGSQAYLVRSFGVPSRPVGRFGGGVAVQYRAVPRSGAGAFSGGILDVGAPGGTPQQAFVGTAAMRQRAVPQQVWGAAAAPGADALSRPVAVLRAPGEPGVFDPRQQLGTGRALGTLASYVPYPLEGGQQVLVAPEVYFPGGVGRLMQPGAETVLTPGQLAPISRALILHPTEAYPEPLTSDQRIAFEFTQLLRKNPAIGAAAQREVDLAAFEQWYAEPATPSVQAPAAATPLTWLQPAPGEQIPAAYQANPLAGWTNVPNWFQRIPLPEGATRY